MLYIAPVPIDLGSEAKMLHGAGKAAKRWHGTLAERIHSHRDAVVFWGVMILGGAAIPLAHANTESATAQAASRKAPSKEGSWPAAAAVLPVCGETQVSDRHFEIYRQITTPKIRVRK